MTRERAAGGGKGASRRTSYARPTSPGSGRSSWSRASRAGLTVRSSGRAPCRSTGAGAIGWSAWQSPGGFRTRAPSRWATGEAASTTRSFAPQRTRRVRAVRARAPPARRASRRRRHADEHLAGLQPARRGRRRRGRHLVRGHRRVETIDTTRPFLDRGVPPHFGHYDLPFLRWLEVHGHEVDYLAQLDLERRSPARLRWRGPTT